MPGIRFSRACQGCGRVIAAGAWCAWCADNDPDAPQRPAVESDERRQNPGGHWSQGRNRTEQGAFRANLIRVYGERCMAMGPPDDAWNIDHPFADLAPGQRCERTTGLQAHHGKDGERDLLLCGTHHGGVDPHARGV